jgi:nitrogen fixation protein FixH
MKKGMGWPIGIAAILLATVASNLAVIFLTKDDPSFAVEPDYYRKAVAWDSTAALRARSTALGWRVDAHTTAVADGTVLALDVLDAQGAPVTGATVQGELLHVARAADVQVVAFTSADAGYAARVAMPRAGVWELRLRAVRGSDTFVETLRVETALADASAPRAVDPGADGP